jgi:hypothetical protein
MERLAALERSGATEGPIKAAWEDAFLDLIYRLTTQPATEVPRRPFATEVYLLPAANSARPSIKLCSRLCAFPVTCMLSICLLCSA